MWFALADDMNTRGRTRRDQVDRENDQPNVEDMQRRMEDMQREMREMAATITNLQQQQPPPPPPPPPPPMAPFYPPGQFHEVPPPGAENGGCLGYLRQFQHLRMPSFKGGAVKPIAAGNWLKKLRKQFEMTQCPEEFKVSVATFFLEEDADDWWDQVKGRFPEGHRFSWAEFQREFENQFFPRATREEMVLQFMRLTQGNSTVNEYTVEFRRLLRFAEHLVPSEEEKVAKYRTGLQPDIRALVELNDYPTLAAVIAQADRVEKTQREVSTQRAKARASAGRSSQTVVHKGKTVVVQPKVEVKTPQVCRYCDKAHPGDCRKAAGKIEFNPIFKAFSPAEVDQQTLQEHASGAGK